MHREFINAVREMLSRHFDIDQIAAKLNVSHDAIRLAIEIINQIST
jgi:orotate phosphoribosyltransferase-like protein